MVVPVLILLITQIMAIPEEMAALLALATQQLPQTVIITVQVLAAVVARLHHLTHPEEATELHSVLAVVQ